MGLPSILPIYAGPAIAFKLDLAGTVEVAGKEVDIPEEWIDELEEYMSSVDFGIAMGTGLGIKAGPGRIVLDARFTLGLTNVNDVPEEFEDEAPKTRNMAISIMAGYMFEF